MQKYCVKSSCTRIATQQRFLAIVFLSCQKQRARNGCHAILGVTASVFQKQTRKMVPPAVSWLIKRSYHRCICRKPGGNTFEVTICAGPIRARMWFKHVETLTILGGILVLNVVRYRFTVDDLFSGLDTTSSCDHWRLIPIFPKLPVAAPDKLMKKQDWDGLGCLMYRHVFGSLGQ